MDAQNETLPKASTGIAGFDQVLGGGFARNRLHLIEGSPGAGKTTIALQFLLAGAARGEIGMYVSLAETAAELRDGARSHGWTIDANIEIFELLASESVLDPDRHQSLLYSSDLELGEATQRIFEAIGRLEPKRVIIDSLSEIRLLAQSSLRYHRQILALKHCFAQNQSTVVLLDDLTAESRDGAVHSIAHSVTCLDQLSPLYGGERRRLRVVKCRGQSFRTGYHDFKIERGGVRVFPRLVAAEHHREAFADTPVKSGIAELDALLGGGLAQGSSTLIIGPAGTGKSLLQLHYVAAAVERGERAAFFAFDEELGLLISRAKGLGFDLRAMRDAGAVVIEQMDTTELSPGEFADRVRGCVDRESIGTVAIDGLDGYLAAMPEERYLILHLHELLQYLNRHGASTFLSVAQHGTIGDMKTIDVTYLADTVILLRYFEAQGHVRRAISVIKKRTGHHEDTIREFSINGAGMTLGPSLAKFQGVLHGVPTYVGSGAPVLRGSG